MLVSCILPDELLQYLPLIIQYH